MSVVLDVQGLEKNFDGVKVLTNFSCSVQQGAILGIIGPNGAGKTTFFNVVSGFLPCESGKVVFKGMEITGFPPHRITNLGISRTFQNIQLVRQISVLDNVLLCFQQQSGEKLRNIFFNWRRSQEQDNEHQNKAVTLLGEAGLTGKADDPAEELSYGQQKLLNIVCCLAMESELLLLDEPVAGIAPEMTERILTTICGLPANGKTVILIEHNLDAVMQVCDHVIFMDAGVKISEGMPDEVKNDPRVIEAYIE